MKYIISLSSALLFSVGLISQSEAIKERELQVEKDYNTQIYAVEPVFDFANISLPATTGAGFQVDSLIGIAPYTPAVGVDIKPIAYRGIANLSGHKAFAKFDKGTANIWHGQGGYTYSAPNYYAITASGEFDQWQDPNIEDQNSRIITGAVAGTYYLTSGLKATTKLGYQQQRLGRFGGLTSQSEPTVQEAGYDNIHAEIGINSFYQNPTKWNYGFQTGVNKWSSIDESATEMNWNLSGFGAYDITNNTTISLRPQAIISNSDYVGNTNVLGLDLIGKTTLKNSTLLIGVQANKAAEDLLIWPSVDIDWKIGESGQITIDSRQEVAPISAFWVSTTNPYIATTSLLSDVPYRLDFKGVHHSQSAALGVNTLLFNDITLSLKGSFQRVQNDLNFFQIEESLTSFDFEMVSYQLAKISINAGHGFLENKVQTGVGISYNYFFDESDLLWHRPVAEGNVHISYIPFEKLSIALRGDFNTPQNLTEVNEEIIQSEWRANASFEISYQLIDKLSINANADNIFNNRYQVWNAHPTFGRNLSAGVLIKL